MFFDKLPDKGLICAHRGARSLAPENTMSALVMAQKCGAHCLETDVQLTKDNALVIFHDDTLGRTTDIAKKKQWQRLQPWPVDQFTIEQLRTLDAGSWFLRTDPFGTIAGGEVTTDRHELIKKQQIPLLRELLTWSTASGFPINIEIKSLNTKPGDVAVVDKIMDLLTAAGAIEYVLLSSFRHEYLLRARSLHPQIELAVLTDTQHPRNLVEYLHHFSAAAYHPNETLCDNELIASLHQAGIRVNCWTVNTTIRAEELLSAGAGIITDWPQHLRS